jgi:8-oxoguanine deaminase
MSGDGCETLLLRNAAYAWTGSPGTRELVSGIDVLLANGRVSQIAANLHTTDKARTIDASGWLLMPGFVNAHHHLSQQLTRTCAVAGGLVEWLAALYPSWSRMDAEAAYAGARVGLAELLLCGVTTVSDFTYFYPHGHADIFDSQVLAAQELGMRFYPVRGGLVELESAVRDRVGTLLDPVLENRDVLLSEVERVATALHDPGPDAMVRVGAGLTEKAYSDRGLMQELADLAERLGLRLHTHLHPRPDERIFAAEVGAHDPISYLRECGWWSERLWVAHGTRLKHDELDAMVRDRVGLCTCPSSNARFATPIAPAWDLHSRGGAVGIGVDGAASNDSGDFLGECRLAWQVQRIRHGAADATPASAPEIIPPAPETVLEWASAGGAALLGWPELGQLVQGGPADIAAFDLDRFDRVGASDPLASLILCGIDRRATFVAVQGRPVVEAGHLVGHDEHEIARTARVAERALSGATSTVVRGG